MFRKATIALIWIFAAAGAGQALAQADPSVAQVYEAAQSGHLEQAQQMINQVLRDHPSSGRAHYVAAELDARTGNISGAQRELNTAQQLEPGLPFARPAAVTALRQEIAQAARGAYGAPVYTRSGGSSFPWGLIGLLIAAVVVVGLLLRRRSASAAAYSAYPSAVPGGPGVPGPMGAPGGFPSVVGGGGSGLMGGLASGLAVGAGIAAGEELVRHVFEPGHPVGGGAAPIAPDAVESAPNGDMGGTDFGMPDAGSWDDGSSGSFGDDGGGWT
jgi:hypothetical protein